MENAKKIDAACIGFAEDGLPCERELLDLGEFSACTVVANDVEIDDDGNLVGTMLISFGPDYSDERRVDPKVAYRMAEVVNDVIDRRSEGEEGDGGIGFCDGDCEHCEGNTYDVTKDDVLKLGEELKQAVDEFGKLIETISKDK